MNWTELINSKINEGYGATIGLAKLVTDKDLAWKPATGSNWMTTGQLLEHLTNAGGTCVKGFVTGDWGLPAGEEMKMPTAAELPAVKSVADAVKRIEADKKLALDMVKKAGEKDLAAKQVAAPWDPTPAPLGKQCLDMVSGHLSTHKAQLFYYLKLMGKPVNTMNLYGM
jgi:hypothetical protein